MFTAQRGDGVGFGQPLILNPHVGTVMVGILLTPIMLALDRRHKARAVHVTSLWLPITFRSICWQQGWQWWWRMSIGWRRRHRENRVKEITVGRKKWCNAVVNLWQGRTAVGASGVEILEEQDNQGKIMAIEELDSGDRDNGVNGVVEGSKSTSQLKQNFDSTVECVPHRFFFPVGILTNGRSFSTYISTCGWHVDMKTSRPVTSLNSEHANHDTFALSHDGGHRTARWKL